MMKKMIYLTTALVMITTNYASASFYSLGHGDLGLGEGENLELHLHLHEGSIVDGAALETDAEYEPDQIGILVPESANTSRPADSIWNFIGNSAGRDTWILPESHAAAESQNLPFLGIGAEEISTDIFANDQIILTLTGVDGPGQFSLYTTALGIPTVFMATSDGITEEDAITVNAGKHGHYNFAFSQAGTYRLTFKVSAIESATQNPVTDEATFIFQVVPEPVTFSLMALGSLLLLSKKR